MIPRLVELANSSLDQINSKIEEDLNELLKCEKTQFYVFSKNSRCFYTFQKNNANQMFKIDPQNSVMAELMNSQDMKQKKLSYQN